MNTQQPNDAINNINNALADTPTNCNNIATLSLTVSDLPTQSELQQVVDKMNALIDALRR